MSPTKRLLFFILLPIAAVLLISPDWLTTAFAAWWMYPVVVVTAILGFFLFRGRSTALTLLIFLMGFNVIMRLMMFFPHIKTETGSWDILFVITSILSIALSTYILLRLDRTDVRIQMVQ